MIHALRTQTFLRPSSRPASPPISTQSQDPLMDRTARPLSKLSLSTFRRASPSLATGLTSLPLTVAQDGSYLEVVGLKLSEAVTKALAQPSGPAAPHEQLGSRRPIPAGRGRTLGALIASEMKASRENLHLHRALIRTLHRPLSVLLTNVSNNVLPLLSSPALLTPLAPTPQAPTLNPTQLHALGWATFAGEVLETFDELGLGLDTDMRGDGLKPVRDGLLSVVKRVVDPLMSGIKNEMTPVIDTLACVYPAPLTPSHGHGSAGGKISTGAKSPIPHPSISTLQTLVPLYSRTLARCATSTTADTILASLLISLIWHGLVALSNRPNLSTSPPGSPAVTPAGLKSKDLIQRSLSISPSTPPSSRFTLKLPPSRPPSPSTNVGARSTTVAADARALYDLLNMLPRPSADKEPTQLAREVVDEAFEALNALAALLEFVRSQAQVARGRPGGSPADACNVIELGRDLDVITTDLPLLIALPVLLRAFVPLPVEGTSEHEHSVASLLGFSEEDYRKGCLSGFGRADECAAAVGQRMSDVLRAQGSVGTMVAPERLEVIVSWIDRQVADVSADH
ncbi:hypothetical protein BKA93DRAFT_721688 [Sparassis latifolia]